MIWLNVKYALHLNYQHKTIIYETITSEPI